MKFVKSLIAASVIAASPAALAAHSLSGKIVDKNNQPIANAEITVHGTNILVYSDDKGQFQIKEATKHIDELHVAAKGYIHQSVEHGHDNTDESVTIVLSKSVIEQIDVYATPLHASILESATPIAVLSDEALQNKHTDTLGETLKFELGVNSTYYGPVASSPIIRGLDGPRVMITQNGLDASDASRVGPDHVVATDTSIVKQVEVLRGPATLFYGSGAIGGVVNVVDNRVPTEVENSLDFSVSQGSAADQQEASFSINTGWDNIALHADAFWRDSEDYDVPANPEEHDEHHDEHGDEHDEHGDEHDEHGDEHEDEHEEHEEFSGKLENSASESSGFNLGASYILDDGFVGFSVGQLDKTYGIPGHSHGHEDHEDETEEEHAAHLVTGEMEQTRYQMLSELTLTNDFFTGVNTKIAFTDYEHSEVEGGVVGTTFKNETLQAKADLLLAEFGDWHGALSFEYKNTDFEAVGDEAFTPPSETETLAASLLLEKHFDNVLVQLGARVESVDLMPTHMDMHDEHEEEHEDEHEGEHEDEHEDEHEHEEHAELHDESFAPVSLSAGLVWDFAEGYNLGISYTYSQRAPSAAEVYANGPHIGTSTYEIGAAYELHQEDGEMHLELAEEELKLETANNLEISLRKFEGDFGFIANVFYNQVDNYYYAANTGLLFEDIHVEGHDEHEDEHMDDHGDDHMDDHDDHGHGAEGELPVYLFGAADAEFYGYEAQFIWQATETLKVTAQTDAIWGELDNGQDLPRIPPARVGFNLNYQGSRLGADLDVMQYMDQENIAAYETETHGYTLVDLYVNYDLSLGKADLTTFLKVSNLLDEEARVHTSFLKNETLLPGRNITIGIRGSL